MSKIDSIEHIQQDVIDCEKCPRLLDYCKEVARVKRKQFSSDQYWGKPVPSFGDPDAKVLIVGLAPAAHGANRTGRMFTGDNSGLWLYRALAKAGLANSVGFEQQPEVANIRDGLQLNGAMITAVARCAPPANKPTPEELKNCSSYLLREIAVLKKVKVFLVLGQIALRNLWAVLPEEIKTSKSFPQFAHGAEIHLKDGRVVLCSYHPSQQNTFTGVLTEAMFDGVFDKIHKYC